MTTSNTYTITTTDGEANLGEYQGTSAEDAIESYARDMGWVNYATGVEAGELSADLTANRVRSPDSTALRLAAADVLGQRCAIEMIEACPLDATDSDGAYLTQVADPIGGVWDALSAKILDPTDEERAAFVRGYREQIQSQIENSGRE